MIDLIKIEGYKPVEGGVCAAKGFKANGVKCGLAHKPLTETAEPANTLPETKKKNDLAMIVSDCPAAAAAVYTSNKVKGAPIAVTKSHLEDGRAQAVIVNSVNANTCNADGREKAEEMCRLAAEVTGLSEKDIIVASTGVIGQPLPIEPIRKGVKPLFEGLSYTGNNEAINAIMTTDTVPKQVAFEFELSGKTCHIGGMIKGSGMIHPNMATTLSFITTDAAVSSELLKKMLSEVVQTTLNCVSVDGDQSTNDMCCVMANGMAENKEVEAESEDYNILYTALYLVLVNLARMMARDGEGATKLIECSCGSAESFEKAKTVAKSVIMSNLFKAAIFGEDANWGRILCAVGYSDAEFDIEKVDVNIASKAGRIAVCRKGAGVDFSEEKAKEILKEESILIEVELNEGSESAFAWGCDLTYNYVKINGDYRS